MLLMQSSQKPTINMLVLAVIDVEKTLQQTIEDAEWSSDSQFADFEKDLARELKECIQGRMRPFTILELLGAILDPEMKNIRQVLDEIPDRDAAKLLRESIRLYVPEAISDETTILVQSQTKKRRASLLEKYSSAALPEESLHNEIERYLTLRLSLSEGSEESEGDRVLTWWRNNQASFPTVAKLAQVILSVPATSAEPERRFSIAGNILRERRCSMDPLTMSKTLFIHDNKHLLGSGQM